MPVVRDDFDQYTDTGAANRACLTAMGLACIQVAQPECPVGKYPKGSGKVGGNLRRSHGYMIAGDHVDVGVTADYGGYVHNGTSGRKANPWLRRAATRNAESIQEAGARAWAGEVR